MKRQKKPADRVASTIKSIFSKNLRTLRIRAGKSQRHFALDNGMDPSYVSHLEAGGSIPSLEAVARSAHGAGVTIAELINGIEGVVAEALAEAKPPPKRSARARQSRKPYAGPPKRWSLADVKVLGLQAGLTLKSRRYVGTSTPYLWTCGVGHKVKANPNNLKARIKNGFIPCVECARIARLPTKGTLDDVREIGAPLGLTLKSKRYIDSSTPYTWVCGSGHSVRINTGNLRVRAKKGRIPCIQCVRIEREKKA